MKNKILIKVLCLVVVCCSCSSIEKLKASFVDTSSLRIETIPSNAIVYKYEKASKTFVSLGKSPINLKSKDLESLRDFTALKIEKKGFVPEHILYDRTSRDSVEYLVPLKAVETWSDQDAEVSSKLAGSIAKKIQDINKFVLKKNLTKSLLLVEELIEQYPKAHTFYDIKGSILLLKGEKNKGISSLKKSISLNPENLETEKLLKVLQGER